MARTAPNSLVVIGTARKPNSSDLKNRSLSGLSDHCPDVELRRAQFELEQAALRELVILRENGTPVSFLRTRIGIGHSATESNVSDSDKETCLDTEREDAAVDVEVEEEEEGGLLGDAMGYCKQIQDSTASVDVPNLPESPVVNEACEPQNAMRKLRNRNPIQLHPYALERDIYCQAVKAGKRG